MTLRRFLQPARRKVVLALLAAALAGAAAWLLAPFCVELPALPEAVDDRVLDRHGCSMGLARGADFYRCQPLPKDKPLPENLVRAILAAEDKRFMEHGGIDWLAVARAAWQRATGRGSSGASTLTMQLAKLCNGSAPRTLRTKAREALQARRLEMLHDKDALLRAYLDRADFGNLCRGAETAAMFYFGKSADALTLPQAALLAALVQAPSRLDPLENPQAALARRNAVLRKLGEPCDAPLGAKAHNINAPVQFAAKPGQKTIDARLQRDVARIAREELDRLYKCNVSQAAVVVIDNRSSELLAALPAANPDSPRGGQMDGTGTPRSAGSALKPFVYLMAFSHGAWPGTVLADVPTLYRSPDGIQAPGNYNDLYFGPVTIRQALACSQNIPAMEALHRYGGVDELLALLRRLGFHLSGDKAEYGLGLAIGNAHVTLLELAHAYSTLARGGAQLPLYADLPHGNASPEQTLNATDCYRIADILGDSGARAAAFGPAPALSFRFRCAAKTGTSSNFRDNWCVGFTKEYTVGVWVGNFDNSSMVRISGISGAGPIFHRVMERLYAHGARASFPDEPEGLKRVEIDTRTGALATQGVPASCRAAELATADDLARLPVGHYDSEGRAVLDSRYAEWFSQTGAGRLYALDPAAPSDRRPAILIPSPGSTLTLDPTLPRAGRIVELRSTLPAATATWSCNTLQLVRRNGRWHAILRPGIHTLQVSTPDGLRASSTFHVMTR